MIRTRCPNCKGKLLPKQRIHPEQRRVSMEIWRPVVGWEGFYEVSNLGRVRSLPRTVFAGKRQWVKEGVVRSPGKDSNGRYQVKLSRNGTYKMCLLHRLVLAAFVGPCPDGMEGCHNDGDCENNRVENLRWDTRSANQIDRRRHGSRKFGEECHLAKFTNAQVVAIRSDKRSNGVIAKEYGASAEYVRQLKARRIVRVLEDASSETL